jgi:hypothetical protein
MARPVRLGSAPPARRRASRRRCEQPGLAMAAPSWFPYRSWLAPLPAPQARRRPEREPAMSVPSHPAGRAQPPHPAVSDRHGRLGPA